MSSTRDIKRRIQSVKNTQQITKAMEMVAASKMRKSQEAALVARPYAERALEILNNVSQKTEPKRHSLLEKREVKKICLLVVTSDKGLCGGLNSAVIKRTQKVIDLNKDKEIALITIGKKARDAFKKKHNIIAEFTNIGDTVELLETTPISRMVIKDYCQGEYDQVIAVYTNFVSTLVQKVACRQIMPITRKSLEEIIEEIEEIKPDVKPEIPTSEIEYKFEPSPEEVLKKLLPALLEIQAFHIILESNASEHSARMVAMKTATDSAKEMLDDLNLTYNYVRQQGITNQITEISAGVAAMES